MLIRFVRVALGVVVMGALGGCGLISSDVTDFDLTLPEKTFTIDTGSWQVNRTAADTYLGQSCSQAPATACAAVQQACTMGCSGSCNAGSGTCDLSLDVSLVQSVNLVAERPELKSIDDEPVIKVTIDSVTYEVTSNSLTVDTPEITIYVAPLSVTKLNRNDTSATAIGTLDAVPAGTTSGSRAVKLTAAGKAELTSIMSTFKTPFNVLAGSSLVVSAGQPIPSGKLEAVVRITAHAGL